MGRVSEKRGYGYGWAQLILIKISRKSKKRQIKCRADQIKKRREIQKKSKIKPEKISQGGSIIKIFE